MTTKEFQEEIILSGFPILEEESELDEETKTFLANEKKPIIITFSSMPLNNPELFACKIVKALEITGNRAIFLTGNSGIRINSNDQILIKKYLPHDLIFREGKGILHHGGVGTMAAALRSGVPQVIMPFNVDQPFWANRLFKLGYALEPLHEGDAIDKFASRFLEMDQKERISNAREIGESLWQEDGNKNAVSSIENLFRQWENRYENIVPEFQRI